MKLVCLLPILLIGFVPTVFADNSLENENLFAESSFITLDIKFGEDKVREGLSRTHITNTLDDVTMSFYGDSIVLSDPQVKVSDSGEHFRISSIPEGVIIYGHYSDSLDNYKVSIYLVNNDELTKFTVNTDFQMPDDKVVEREPEEEKAAYVPELIITSSHDFRTYWKETFNIDIQTFDANINPNPIYSDFNGRVDNAEVNVLLSLNDEQVAALSGQTENGEWEGSYYFQENITPPGEYTVDIIVTYLDQTVSKTSSMFVIGSVSNSGGSSNAGTNSQG